MRKISFRIDPDTKAAATQVAAAHGLTLAQLVQEFLYRYVLTAPPPVRTIPNTRGAPTTTVFVGEKLGKAARIRAEANGEDLSRPIVEFLTRTAMQPPTHPDPQNTRTEHE